MYFVHGTTIDNEQKISSGWKDVELSELGIEQSKKLGELVDGTQFAAIFCSDLQRAKDSAELSWGNIQKAIPDARLRECNYGEYNSKPSSEVEPMQEKSITNPMPGGESYEMVKERIADFLQEVQEKYNGKTIAIVAHKAPQLALDVLVKGMSWEQAFANDWRKKKAWQPGWGYVVKK